MALGAMQIRVTAWRLFGTCTSRVVPCTSQAPSSPSPMATQTRCRGAWSAMAVTGCRAAGADCGTGNSLRRSWPDEACRIEMRPDADPIQIALPMRHDVIWRPARRVCFTNS